MADIDIERKKRNPLPLIAGLLVLALLAFLLMRNRDDDAPAGAPVTDTTTVPAATTPAP